MISRHQHGAIDMYRERVHGSGKSLFKFNAHTNSIRAVAAAVPAVGMAVEIPMAALESRADPANAFSGPPQSASSCKPTQKGSMRHMSMHARNRKGELKPGSDVEGQLPCMALDSFFLGR